MQYWVFGSGFYDEIEVSRQRWRHDKNHRKWQRTNFDEQYIGQILKKGFENNR